MNKNYSYLTDPKYLDLIIKRNENLRIYNNLMKIKYQKMIDLEFINNDIERLNNNISIVKHEENLIKDDIQKVIKKYEKEDNQNGS